MFNLRRSLFLVGILCLASFLAWTQQPKAQAPVAPGTVIKTETRLVLVDTVVTDKKGNYIHDLTTKDFRVWEDDKEQVIKTFSFGADPGLAPASPRRYLVVFFDNSTMDMADQIRARQAAAKFVEATAGANHMMAIVNFGGTLQVAQNFTENVDRLKAVLSGLRFSTVSGSETASLGTPPLSTTATEFGTRTMLLSLRNLAKNLSSVPGRKIVILLTAGFPVTPERLSEATATIEVCNKSNVAVYPIDVRGLITPVSVGPRGSLLEPAPASQPLRLSLARLGSAMAGLSGARLQAASFTPAFWTAPQRPTTPTPQQPPATGGTPSSPTRGPTPAEPGGATTPATPGRATSPATPGGATTPAAPGTSAPRAPGGDASRTAPGAGAGTTRGGALDRGAMPYPGYPGAQPRVILPKFPETVASNQQLMHLLADGTGGFVIYNTNDLLAGLEKIGKEQDEYYILGYSPAEAEEGSCHSLRVKVNRGGTVVRARSGYCIVKPRDLLAGNPIELELQNRATGSQPGNVAASMQLPFFYTSVNVARVNVAMEIPAATIQFEKQKGKFHSELNVLGIAYTRDGAVAARFSDTAKLEFENKGEVETFQKRPYHYENQFELASGQYNFKVVFSSSKDSFGKLEMPLVVEPYDSGQFSISGLALSKEVRRASDLGTSLDVALIEDRTPLIAQGLQVVPSGSNRFKKTDQAFIYFEIYEPLLLAPESQKLPEVGIQIRVLDRNTGEQKIDSGMFGIAVPDKGGNPVIPVGTKIPLASFAPGSYRLELTAMDSAGKSFKRSTDFDIE